MKMFLKVKFRSLVQHIIKNHIVYTTTALLLTTGGLVWAEFSVPNFHEDLENKSYKKYLSGNLLETMAGTYEPPVVLSPKAGERYLAGKNMKIEWEGQHKNTHLYLVPHVESEETVLIEKNVQGKNYDWLVPKGVERGSYAIGVKNGHDLARSEGLFVIHSEDSNLQRQQIDYPPMEAEKKIKALVEKEVPDPTFDLEMSLISVNLTQRVDEALNQEKTDRKDLNKPSGQQKIERKKREGANALKLGKSKSEVEPDSKLKSEFKVILNPVRPKAEKRFEAEAEKKLSQKAQNEASKAMEIEKADRLEIQSAGVKGEAFIYLQKELGNGKILEVHTKPQHEGKNQGLKHGRVN